MMWPIFYVVLTIVCVQARVRLDPLVNTNQGLVRGLKADDGDYSMFLGIPYAQVNASNPFGASIPHPAFDTIFEASDDSAICPQVEEFDNTIVGDLDCLHLNIYVPDSASTRNRLPVLIWIYGGGFTIGFAGRYLYGAKYLVQHYVILVTMNYRVGPYGFFCLDIPEVPGNQGLKDQLLALRWINDNIAAFGGDVNKITVMGESAGAASVESHIYSKQEKLFHQAIMQSGSITGPWAVMPSDNTVPLKIAEKLGFVTENLYAALDFLSSTDSRLVIGASSDLSLNYRTCVEKNFENVEQFILEDPHSSSVPKARTTPVLAGYNSHEYLIQFINQPPEFYESLNIFSEYLSTIFDFGDDADVMEDIVRHFYIGDEEFSEDVKDGLAAFSSDFYFIYPQQYSLQKLSNSGSPNIYFYEFGYSGSRNFMKKRYNFTDGGAVHADEITYLFDGLFDQDKPTVEDQLVIDRMTTLWTNFVKYGDPTPAISDLLVEKWLPVSNDKLNYLEINSELKMKARPYNDRLAFWDLFFKANKQYLKYNSPQK